MPERVLLLFAVLFVTAAPSAHAYLDPASGSMFLQFLLAAIAGALVSIRIFWNKILGVMSGKKDEPDGSGS